MDKSLNCVMLVDDDEAVNYFHREILEDTGFAKHIIVADNASKALSLLEKADNEACCNPDVIFLDLNMPLMCGWDFVQRLVDKKTGDSTLPLIFILTALVNVNNVKRADGNEIISGFFPKPLTEEILDEIFSRYFSNS